MVKNFQLKLTLSGKVVKNFELSFPEFRYNRHSESYLFLPQNTILTKVN